KGPKALGELPATLAQVAKGARLDTARSADEVLGSLRPELAYEEAFKVGYLSVPRRGPPLLLLSEVEPSVPSERVGRVASRLAEDGADVIVVGATPSWPPAELGKRVREALRAGRPVLAEAPNLGMAEEAISVGAEGVFASPELAVEAKGELKGIVVVASSRDITELRRVESELRGSRLVVDPVVDVPPLGLAKSIERYQEASARLSSPVLFSAADATEDVEADTGGMHALLALIAVELRASAYLVVEETYKSMRGTAEAREAIRLAEAAWQGKSTERGMFSRLLVLKQATSPPTVRPQDEVERVGYVEPRMSSDQYLIISTDHNSGEVLVTFMKDGRPQGTVSGKHAMSVARAAVRRFGLEPEHAAYLGYEVAKAELALKLGRTYTQDEPIIVTPWEKNGNSGGRH
ncbi:MAG: DUF4346 domain-containing protein, partial [Acidilobus sp.]